MSAAPQNTGDPHIKLLITLWHYRKRTGMVNERGVRFPWSLRRVLISEVIMVMALLLLLKHLCIKTQRGELLGSGHINNLNGHELV